MDWLFQDWFVGYANVWLVGAIRYGAKYETKATTAATNPDMPRM